MEYIKKKIEKIDFSKISPEAKAEFETMKKNTNNFTPFVGENADTNNKEMRVVFDILYHDIIEVETPEAITKFEKKVVKREVPKKTKEIKKKETPDKKVIVKSKEIKPEKKEIKFSKVDLKEKGETETNEIEHCRKLLESANYTIKSSKNKTGTKKITSKIKRQDKTIIKDRVESSFVPITKDISGSKEKDEKYKDVIKTISKIQDIFTIVLQGLDKLAKNNEVDKLNEILDIFEKFVKEAPKFGKGTKLSKGGKINRSRDMKFLSHQEHEKIYKPKRKRKYSIYKVKSNKAKT